MCIVWKDLRAVGLSNQLIKKKHKTQVQLNTEFYTAADTCLQRSENTQGKYREKRNNKRIDKKYFSKQAFTKRY